MKKNTYFNERTCCPSCGSTKITNIYQLPYKNEEIRFYLTEFYSPVGGIEYQYLEDAEYIIDKCIDCGLYYQKFVPNDLLMERLYDHWINPEITFKNHSQKKALNEYSFLAQEIMIQIAITGKLPNQLDFFDFGMGWATWAIMAKSFGVNVYGAELSKKRILHAEENGIKVVNFPEVAEYKFDFINTEQVFEHLPNPYETIIELKKLLKPSGILKISVPNGYDISKRLNKMDWSEKKGSEYSLNDLSPLEHINCFNYESLVKLANKAGLEEYRIPLDISLKYNIGYATNYSYLKNCIKPYYVNFFKKGTYLFFKIKQ